MPKKRTRYTKKFIIIRSKQTSLVKIGFEGGGEVPAELHGYFTQEKYAWDAIARYKISKGID